jgi:ASPIC/UnbV protein/VCBS repeat protein
VHSAAITAPDAATRRMVQRLARLGRGHDQRLVEQRPEATLARSARHVTAPVDLRSRLILDASRAYDLLLLGQAREAAALLQSVKEAAVANPRLLEPQFTWVVKAYLAVAYLRTGEQENCVQHHQPQSCLLPIRASGVHAQREGSRLAAREYAEILKDNPGDLTARWLLNLAAMTLGEHPQGVPPEQVIPESVFDSEGPMGRFQEVAGERGIQAPGLVGGSAMDDFDGDGDADIVASSYGLDGERDQLRYFRNEGQGRFSDRTAEAGLLGLVGGINLAQADYDNDGDVDLLVVRGGWLLGDLGQQPPSLLRNDGRGHFVDRTEAAGLLFQHPAQGAAWGDYDNDGWLDLFVGLESSNVPSFDIPLYLPFKPAPLRASKLFHNNRNGTFTDVARLAGLDVVAYVKGAAWGDYDNDGRLDLAITQSYGPTMLCRNLGRDARGRWRFEEPQGLEPRRGLATWFWDYDNDGWLDLFVSGYPTDGDAYAAGQVAASYLGQPVTTETARLFHNVRGRFEDVTAEARLDRILFGAGGNFGDFDNDGWDDVYVSTGAADYRALMPNRMFRNSGGGSFQDVTTAAGVGHLQKGGAVSVGDVDGDGDVDLYLVVGGEFPGDGFLDALFINPGSGNHWITLRLFGTRSNRSAIGARVAVRVRTAGGTREIHRLVGSGGSFGASTLQQEIGLGQATAVESVTVRWPSGLVEEFTDVRLDAVAPLKEGAGRAPASRSAGRTCPACRPRTG